MIVRRSSMRAGVHPSAACFGVAGPVRDGRSVTTNLPWVIDAAELGRQLGARTWVINDLEATAWGLAALTPERARRAVARRRPTASGNAAVIAAGTGLGEAGTVLGRAAAPAVRDRGRPRQLRTARRRGGRAAASGSGERFAAARELGARRLRARASSSLYEFLRDTGRGEEPPRLADGDTRRRSRRGHHAPRRSTARARWRRRRCDRFVALYGAEAGNLALKLMATGGVYLGGGIAPRILPKLRDGTFLRRFLDKGRMRPLLESMPVRVVLNDRCGLLGAGRCAAVRSAGS